MPVIEVADAQGLVEAAVTAVSVLGGAMAYFSGYAAAQAVMNGEPPEVLAHEVNGGLAQGFIAGSPLSVLALILEVCA